MNSIVVMSLIPDAGHIIPSLRIAQALRTSNADVVWVVAPEEARTLMDRLPAGYQFVSLGHVMPSNYRRLLSEWSTASRLSRLTYLSSFMDRHYFMPVSHAGFLTLHKLCEVVASLSPRLLVADDHLFAGAYATVASLLNVPIVLQRACGSLFPEQAAAGMPWKRQNRSKVIVDHIASSASTTVAKMFRKVFRRDAERRYRAMLGELRIFWADASKELKNTAHLTLRVSSGTGPLEREFFRERQGETHIHHLGPLPSFRWNSSSAVSDWIRSDSTPVVLIGFGTMSIGRRIDHRALLNSVSKAGYRALLVLSDPGSLASQLDPRRQYCTPWVDQAAILKEEHTTLFLSQAGSGALQDSLLAGVPMVCAPLGWDQPYNAWLTEQLGFGVRLHDQSAVAGLEASIRKAEQLRDRAIQLRKLVESLDSNETLVRLVRERLSVKVG